MLHLWFQLFFAPFLINANVFAQSFDETTLELVVATFRHGERTPYSFFAKDPYSDAKYWPDGKVQLISAGKKRMYNLGRSLRRRYENFLTDSPREVYVRSSFQDRCIESANLVMHGLYRANGRWTYDSTTDYLPVPVHTVPTADDGMLTVDSDCPEAKEEKRRLLHNEINTEYMRNHSKILSLIYNKTGAILTDLNNISDYYVTVLIEKDQGLKLADWMTDEFMEELKIMSDYSYYASESSVKQRRFRMTNLFRDIKERILAKLISNDTSTTSSRLIAYSTHDNILSAMLISLDVWNAKMPPYGATVIIEMHQNLTGNRFIKLFYWNETELSEPYPLKISYCNNSYVCPLDTFLDHLDYYTFDDWRLECGLIDCTSVWNDPFFIMLVILIAMILIAVFLWWLRYKEYDCTRKGYTVISD